jgi:N-acetylmuramoyl-L-alanine amidase
MKNLTKLAIVAAISCNLTSALNAQEKAEWGDFKLWIDPGHSQTENMGMYGYTEAQKVLRVGLATREYLKEFTTATNANIQMTRDDDQDYVSLEERSDMANAWGADFFYSIHSDAGGNTNSTLLLFGGWRKNGVEIEKTPHGGKAYGEILCPNLTSVMYETTTRGNWHDRCWYDPTPTTHTNQFPYLSVNRRTNMASLLSEGGFHTLPMQQALNMNESYKRLEAFGTFRSILEYRGIERPEKVMLAGVVKNSENGKPLDNVTVTCNGQTVVTDSYESLFHYYVNNEDLVHNGFFLFEGLTPGGTYEISYSCPGFITTTKTVTMQHDTQGLAGNNVTWGNISLTSNAPAVVLSNSISNPNDVEIDNDMVLTFSRKMNRESVAQAFSINNAGQVTLSWDNDYTLRVALSQLLYGTSYTITIDGSIACNSQTNQLLDGDADGVEGGNYVFSFITEPADVEGPHIVSTTPAEGETMLYTLRPAIRVEFNEVLAWNNDNTNEMIVLECADGETVQGLLTHMVVRDASVVHFYPLADLKRDKTYRFKVHGTFADLLGNTSNITKYVRFMTEYRPVLDYTMIEDGSVLSHWWHPDISGSTTHTTSKDGVAGANSNYIALSNTTSRTDLTSSYLLHYEFNQNCDGPWQIREYRSYNQNNFFSDSYNAVLQCEVFSDGSNNQVCHMVRLNGTGASGIIQNEHVVLDFRGWKTMAFDIYNAPFIHFTGEGETISPAQKWCYDSFYLCHDNTDEQYDTNGHLLPVQAWDGDILFGNIKYVHYDRTAVQTASINDMPGSPAISGDVNGDGHVNSADVTALYNLMLNNDTSSIVNGDQDNDGSITAGDITSVYSIMLGN